MAAAVVLSFDGIGKRGDARAHWARRFSALEAAGCDAVVPAQDVKLFAMGIAGELRAKFEEVDKSARPAALTPIGAIDQSAQFADVREHFGNRSLLRQANRLDGTGSSGIAGKAPARVAGIRELAREAPSCPLPKA